MFTSQSNPSADVPTQNTSCNVVQVAPEDESIDNLEARVTRNMQATPLWRKCIILFALSWVTLSACFSSTVFFSTTSEIAEEFRVPKEAVDIANAGVLLTLGMSTFVWGPVELILGRWIAYNGCILALLVFTIVAAVAASFEVFVVVRILSGFQGTYFHVAAQTIIAEYFPPIQRGTATGIFLAVVSAFGSPFGPLVAAIVVQYRSWRVVLWLQTAMILLGLVLSMFFIDFDTGGTRSSSVSKDNRSVRKIFSHLSPFNILGCLKHPSVTLTDVACGLISFCQFFLLAAPRHILTTRFHIQSPITTALFYISPAAGFLVGTLVGGYHSDHVVKKYIRIRNGVRVPQDRLKSGWISFFLVIPIAYLVFGWGSQCTECSRPRLAAPIIGAFFASVGIFDAVTGLNTFCAEVLPQRRRDACASKYFVQYCFIATASAVAVPVIDAVGMGLASVICVGFVLASGTLTLITARYGARMQKWLGNISKKSHALHMF